MMKILFIILSGLIIYAVFVVMVGRFCGLSDYPNDEHDN